MVARDDGGEVSVAGWEGGVWLEAAVGTGWEAEVWLVSILVLLLLLAPGGCLLAPVSLCVTLSSLSRTAR